ncbi:5-formyltetrahydrofolate cyclo-ligase [Knoellia sp. CPCC 206450]|uniref:5-formyltetrahydrofolate cyclo-ligase n=1 Tax=Knoellia tibetensis TaxID=3404798 RepID=UPI003B42B730
MASTSPAEDKTALRPGLLARRREHINGRDRDADDTTLAEHVLALVADLGLDAGDTVAAYESMRTEPPLAATIDALVAHGIRVLVPVTLPDNDLDWCDATDPARMPAGPGAVSAAGLVLAPGLAADRTGTRLGRGGGSYDRALARRAGTAKVVVVLHPGEVSAEPLPRDDHDLPVDGVLTADGLEWF